MTGFILRSAAFAALVCVAGCGKPALPRVVAKGKLVQGGKAFVLDLAKSKMPGGTSLPPGDKGLSVTFYPENIEGGDTELATVDTATGTFTLNGPDGKGVRPGIYRVSVTVGPRGGEDQLKGKFGPDKTTIKKQVDGTDEIVIDLDKPNG